ncbi:uncharacterized protein EI90DRAFT_3139011 [Cantharellus anzutake]|uniref:uncharacterized protein n=1 Tax=Cantharellus anzutake TaxID=1750568 RepID=UPI001902ED13|nr:uncharacterized protein EI90DRAFT_3139011 [Cantharellus anzutake]KAF8310917.1 hypothetical protein EI90DRAFT_3139011 [Cantharellus anzutake]
MLEIHWEVRANPESPNVLTWDRASGMGVVKGECAKIQAGAETVGMEGDDGKWGEQILDEFPWFDILDSWWDGQPKYSDVLISNSSAPGKELSAAYEKLLDESTDSPNHPSSILLSDKGGGSEAALYGQSDPEKDGADLSSHTLMNLSSPFSSPAIHTPTLSPKFDPEPIDQKLKMAKMPSPPLTLINTPFHPVPQFHHIPFSKRTASMTSLVNSI